MDYFYIDMTKIYTIGFSGKKNADIFIHALAVGWKYKQIYESGTCVKHIARNEQRDIRKIYKYLNLAYLSPRIINDIMNGKI